MPEDPAERTDKPEVLAGGETMKYYSKPKRAAYPPQIGCAKEIVEYMRKHSPGSFVNVMVMGKAVNQGVRV